MKNTDFTVAELREMQDALQREQMRMCTVGQTRQELEYQSLENVWSARKKLIDVLLGVPLPAWVDEAEQQVAAAIANPKIIEED